MKAFIVLALVAVAAARSLDVDTLRLLSKEKSLLTRDDLLLKDTNRFINRFNTKKGLLHNTFDYDYTTPSVYRDDVDVDSWFQRRVTILSIPELIDHPLFAEYMSYPLFRQFWEQYPVVFRRYLESPLFQQFWTVPEFQKYFSNSYYFYKYIFPQVQAISQTEGVHDRYNYDVQDFIRKPYNVEDYVRKTYNVEDYLRRPFEREVTVGDYWNKIFGHRDVDRMLPYAYHTQDRYTTPSVYGRHFGLNNNVNYKFLLDKIYRTLFVNRPVEGEVTQVRTDVKVAPAHKEIDQITGQTLVEGPKIVDVKVDERVVPTTEARHMDVDTQTEVIRKEVLLRHLLKERHITYQLYTVLKTLPLHHVKEIVRRIVPTFDFETVFGKHVTFPTYNNFDDVTAFPTHNYVDDVAYPTYNWNVDNTIDTNDVTFRHKINQIVNHLYNNEIVGDRYTPVIRDLLKVLGHNQVVPTLRV